MAILILNAVSNDRQAMLDRLDVEAAEFLGSALKERFTVRNPNGGVRTEVREIVVDDNRPSVIERTAVQTTAG
jgi:hypothetical protein